MPYADVKPIDASEIPVVDLAAPLPRVAGEMLRASEASGFFYVRNHGVADALIRGVSAQAREFFARPQPQKLEVRVRDCHRGFIPTGEARMYEQARVDLKESYIWGLEGGAAPNRWPGFQPEMRSVLNRYFTECNQLGFQLMRAFALALEIDEEYFVRVIDRPISRGSLIYYPPQPPFLEHDQFGVAPHSDYGCLTLLYQTDVGGLEVLGKSGEWLTAHPVERTFVVNVGDLLARWTNGRFASTAHRVVNRSGRERLSIAVFVDPNEETLIQPVCRPGEAPRYPSVTCGAYIRSRFDAAFEYRKSAGKA